MPSPSFVPLTLDEFRKLVERFEFSIRSIDSVHMHHTWRPRGRDFRGLATIVGMWQHHTATMKWSDIAQHVTIDPDGIIWTGRSWHQPPASSGGANGDSRRGPFMFETVGDFDTGQEALKGRQLESVIGVITAVQRRNGLEPESLRFHRDLGSPKSCPGTGVSYADILRRVRAAHAEALHGGARRRRVVASRRVAPGEVAPPFVIDELRVTAALSAIDVTGGAIDVPRAGMELIERAADGEEASVRSRRGARGARRASAAAATAKSSGKHGAAPNAWTLGPRVERACRVIPYDRRSEDPVKRPLRIFALDPSVSRLHGNVATVHVPYEPLLPGPIGNVLEVDSRQFDRKGRVQRANEALDLEKAPLMLAAGLEPTQSDSRFHAQMVYAVCSTIYQRFREALGRNVAWGFDALPGDDGVSPLRLRIRTLGVVEQNAYYDPENAEMVFGYYAAKPDETIGNNLPRGYVFTCLGQDVVAHECTHALLDGLRAHFTITTHPDVAAFHEGFADVVALLSRFSHRDVVREAMRASRGRLDTEHLTAIGRQFGETSGDFGPIRNAIDYEVNERGEKEYPDFRNTLEAHDRGRHLCAAVYEAFVTIFDRKKERFVRLATGGTGLLDPRHELSADLLEVLTDLACSLATQFLNICIRAIDYCPPVDLRFGDYLRAVITADRDMVPDDPYGYREAWIDAFRRRQIYPDDVTNLGEDALLWRPPQLPLPKVKALSFAELAFEGDPGRVPLRAELLRQANEIGAMITQPKFLREFGLVDPKAKRPARVVSVDSPIVESVRTARRVGPNGNVMYDLVAEVTQRVVHRHGSQRIVLYGGSTVLIDAFGAVRFVIRKRVLREQEDKAAIAFLRSRAGAVYWKERNGTTVPLRAGFRLAHKHRQRGKKKR